MKNFKKAQIKMGETIAIMFVFFILLIIGGIFYMNFQRTTVSREIAVAYDLRSVEISQVISFLPEVQCTDYNVVRPSCFDLYKLVAMSDVVANNEDYQNIYEREFEFTTIVLKEVYPGSHEWTLYDRPKVSLDRDGNEVESFTSAAVTNIPLALFNTSSGDYSFGVLEITTYQ